MSHSNFAFLRDGYEALANLGNDAECHIHQDPQAALVKLRCFAETLVGLIYSELSIEIEPEADLYRRLNHRHFKDVVDRSIVAKLDALRIDGNKAAHNYVKHSKTHSLWLLKEAFLIGKWFIQTIKQTYVDIPDYVEPKPLPQADENAPNSNNDLQEQIVQHSEALIAAEEELKLLREQLVEAQRNQTKKTEYQVLETFKEASKFAASSFDLQMNITRKNIDIFDSFQQHSLTESQTQLVKQLDHFLNKGKESVFLLKGYAGTGKTFITDGLTQYLTAIGRQFEVMAPTGKAAKVISDKIGLDASTIHRVIYNYENVKEYSLDGVEGSETFRCYAEIKVNQNTSETVYIIDEASMVSDCYSDSEFFRFGSGYLLKDLLSYINLDHNDHTKKVIFIGDNAQLPPVGMNVSPALDAKYLKNKYQLISDEFELTEVVRQKADSGIMDNASSLRDSMQANVFNKLDFQVNGIDVHELSSESVLTQFLTVCDNKLANTKNAILIASSNAQVSQYNKVVREHFFPLQSEVVAGDKVISVANHYVKDKVITNGEFGMVRKVFSEPEIRKVVLRKKGEDNTSITLTVALQFRDVELGFRDENGDVSFFDCKIVENLLYNDEPSLSSDEYKALYVDFVNRHPELRSKDKKNEFRLELLADPYFNAFKVKFGYAITCHKAQGSEWQNVFLKCSSHHKTLSQDYFRWLYTAITRTSSQLFVLDPPKVKLGKGLTRVGRNDKTIVDETPSVMEHELDSSNLNPTITSTLPSQNEAIHEGNHFFHNLYVEVSNLLSNLDIKVVEVTHNQYQEVYLCQHGEEFATARISYNSKNKISSINCSIDNILGNLVSEKLSNLIGKLITSTSEPATSKFEFPEPFLEEFHIQLSNTLKQHDILISEVLARDYAQRYCFIKSGETAVVDIFYNGKSQFTRLMGMKNLSSSEKLMDKVEGLIEEAFN